MLLDFLKTKRNKKELNIVLNTLWEFKDCESSDEWLGIPFQAWVKLEQFEDYLRLLTNREVNKINDDKAKEFYKKLGEN